MNPVQGKIQRSPASVIRRVLWSRALWHTMGHDARCAWLAAVSRWSKEHKPAESALQQLLAYAAKEPTNPDSPITPASHPASTAILSILPALPTNHANTAIDTLGQSLLYTPHHNSPAITLILAKRKQSPKLLAQAINALSKPSTTETSTTETSTTAHLIREAAELTTTLIPALRSRQASATHSDLLALRAAWAHILQSHPRPDPAIIKAAAQSAAIAPLPPHKSAPPAPPALRSAIRDARSQNLVSLDDALRLLADHQTSSAAESRLFPPNQTQHSPPSPSAVAQTLASARPLLLNPARKQALARAAKQLGTRRGAPPSPLDTNNIDELETFNLPARLGRIAWWATTPRPTPTREAALTPHLTDPSPIARHALLRSTANNTLLKGLAEDLCFDQDQRIARSAAIALATTANQTGNTTPPILATLCRSPHPAIRRLFPSTNRPQSTRSKLQPKQAQTQQTSTSAEHIRSLLASANLQSLLLGLHLAPQAAANTTNQPWQIERIASDIASLTHSNHPAIARQAKRTLQRVRWTLHRRWQSTPPASSQNPTNTQSTQAFSSGLAAPLALLLTQPIWLEKAPETQASTTTAPIPGRFTTWLPDSTLSSTTIAIAASAAIAITLITRLAIRRYRAWKSLTPQERAYRFGCATLCLRKQQQQQLRWLAETAGQHPLAILLNHNHFAAALIPAVTHPDWPKHAPHIARLGATLASAIPPRD